MEFNPSLVGAAQQDPARADLIFAQALLETLRGHVTPMVDMAIVLETARSLTDWQMQERLDNPESVNTDPAGDLLRLLLCEHVEALRTATKTDAPSP